MAKTDASQHNLHPNRRIPSPKSPENHKIANRSLKHGSDKEDRGKSPKEMQRRHYRNSQKP